MVLKYGLFSILMSCIMLNYACKKSSDAATATTGTFTTSSTAFTNNGMLPKLYTCDSTGISPKLSWTNAPAGTTSFAIVMHHIPPTPPNHVYMVLYNIPATVTSIGNAFSGVGLFASIQLM